MRARLALSVVLCLPLLRALAADEPDAAQRLMAATLAPTPVLADLRELTDTVGGRPTE